MIKNLLKRNLENPSHPLTSSALVEALGGTTTWAGGTLSTSESLSVSTCYACISLIAGTIGTLPTHVFKDDGDNRIKAMNHPMALIVSRSPNPEMTAAELWETVAAWQLIHGRGYLHPTRDVNARITGLWPIPPNKVKRGRSPSKQRVYRVRLGEEDFAGDLISDQDVVLTADELWEFPSFLGISILGLARQSLGAARAAEEYGARFFSQGATPGGVLTTDEELDDEKFNRMKARWRQFHEGTRNAHLMALLEGGMDWKATGVSNQDAQFLETRRFSVSDIARYFRVPPHMVGDVERSTSWGTGIEAQAIGFVKFSLVDRLVRLEQVVNKWGLRTGFYMKFSTSGLERGDIASRYNAYAIGRQWGFLSTNDIRSLEDMPPVEDGDIYLQPLNMIEAGTIEEEIEEPTEEPIEEEPEVRDALEREEIERVSRLEAMGGREGRRRVDSGLSRNGSRGEEAAASLVRTGK